MNTLEAEIKKLETDIENMKQDMNTSGNQPESVAAPDLSIQAPLPPANTAIGDVIAELKAHNVAKTIQRAGEWGLCKDWKLWNRLCGNL